MEIVVESKFKVGDLVHKYKEEQECTKFVRCPLCDGKHSVEKPEGMLDADEEDDGYEKMLTCSYCNSDGLIPVEFKYERRIDSEVYKVDSVYVSIDQDGISCCYGITSTPELNDREYMYVSGSADEDMLVSLSEEEIAKVKGRL